MMQPALMNTTEIVAQMCVCIDEYLSCDKPDPTLLLNALDIWEPFYIDATRAEGMTSAGYLEEAWLVAVHGVRQLARLGLAMIHQPNHRLQILMRMVLRNDYVLHLYAQRISVERESLIDHTTSETNLAAADGRFADAAKHFLTYLLVLYASAAMAVLTFFTVLMKICVSLINICTFIPIDLSFRLLRAGPMTTSASLVKISISFMYYKLHRVLTGHWGL